MFTELLEKLTRHEDLTADEAAAAMAEIMEGRAAPAHIAALLTGLAMKGERPIEIVGLARTMRAQAVQVSRHYDDVFDTCGTGGDRAGTFNISSCAALVVAGAGGLGAPPPPRGGSQGWPMPGPGAAPAAPTSTRRSVSESRRRRRSSSAVSAK